MFHNLFQHESAESPVGNYLYEAYQNKLNEKQQAEARKTLGIG